MVSFFNFYVIWKEFKLLFQMIRDYFSGKYKKVSISTLVGIIISSVYVISPIDLIPELIILIGVIDDLFVVRLLLFFVKKDLIKYKHWREN